MPATPWRTFGSPESNGDFVALLSYLPLKSYWGVFRLAFYAPQVVKQLKAAHGLMGYSLLARPLSKRFWTLSAWENDEALRAFVQDPPHVTIMAALAPSELKHDFRESMERLRKYWDEHVPKKTEKLKAEPV